MPKADGKPTTRNLDWANIKEEPNQTPNENIRPRGSRLGGTTIASRRIGVSGSRRRQRGASPAGQSPDDYYDCADWPGLLLHRSLNRSDWWKLLATPACPNSQHDWRDNVSETTGLTSAAFSTRGKNQLEMVFQQVFQEAAGDGVAKLSVEQFPHCRTNCHTGSGSVSIKLPTSIIARQRGSSQPSSAGRPGISELAWAMAFVTVMVSIFLCVLKK